MMAAEEKHYFVCANTAQGFVDHFSGNLAGLDRVFILKGGSGTGKSTLMRRIGQAYQDGGEEVDYIHCSSDADSLDGVIIPHLSVAIVDGTAPHVLEPRLVGVTEDYVNMGVALNRQKLAPYKKEMLELKQESSRQYAEMYVHLHQAAQALEKAAVTVKAPEPPLDGWQQELTEQILGKKVLLKKSDIKQRFCGALTVNGDTYPGLAIAKSAKTRYFLGGCYGQEVLQMLAEEAIGRGYDAEIYYDHFQPEKMIFCHLPEKSLCLLDDNYSATSSCKTANDICHPIGQTQPTITSTEYDHWRGQAMACLEKARQAHTALEKYYYPAVDFEVVEQIYDVIHSEIAAL